MALRILNMMQAYFGHTSTTPYVPQTYRVRLHGLKKKTSNKLVKSLITKNTNRLNRFQGNKTLRTKEINKLRDKINKISEFVLKEKQFLTVAVVNCGIIISRRSFL
jgi:hypothetical protein